MLIKITTKRQATFPARVLDALGVKPGDRIELLERPEGFMLRARRIDFSKLGTARGKLRKGQGTFDIRKFRDATYDKALRD